ncbi:MAG: SDR family oxidoreductase [Defluviitaleaceae bacterium]|nr:SDR family oxidoreductase [Defluviitaleaceae bacterium]MCL2261866.1 SDR family oxidoreductase [Defluviitaleaceae bacterium]
MRTVLVTGSARGIGFAIAKAFAEQDCRIILNCRTDAAQLQKAIAELESIADVTGFCADVSDYNRCVQMIKQAEARFGTIDVLVNNAGEAHFGLFTDMTAWEIQNVLAANLLTAANASHIVIPSMVRKKRGCIINISSIWGVTGASCEAMYSAAKAGVNGLTKALAKELAPSNIRVNAIACGAFDTRMNHRLSPHEKNAFTEDIPLGRFGIPAEVGSLATFLASDSASYLTGQIIPLDGGVV